MRRLSAPLAPETIAFFLRVSGIGGYVAVFPSIDGESNWPEGAEQSATSAIVDIAFDLVP